MTPEQREELKPCPFCGDKMDLPIHDQVEWGAGLIYVSCDCGASSPGCKTREDAIAAWNRRAQVEALTVPQWISVEDRLPPDGEMVLVSVRNGVASSETNAEYYECEEARVVDFGEFKEYIGCMQCYGGPHGAFADDITHWMPLPAAPTIPAIPGTKGAT